MICLKEVFCISIDVEKMPKLGFGLRRLPMKDNLSTFTNFKPLSEEEKKAIEAAKEIMQGKPTIGCTSCRYCCDGCPMGIKIPDIFTLENAIRIYNEGCRPA